MTVRDLIVELLDCDLNKAVSVEFPNNSRQTDNYYKYEQADYFRIIESDYCVIIGVDDV